MPQALNKKRRIPNSQYRKTVGAFLFAAVWDGQRGGHICTWGAKNAG